MGAVAGLECNGSRRHLFVLLHAFCQRPKNLTPVKQAIKDAYPDADIYLPKMPFAGAFGWLCTQDAPDVAARLIGLIDAIVDARRSASGEGYESVNFVGHSMGAVFARKIAIVAHGEQNRSDCPTLHAPFEPAFEEFKAKPRSWAPLIQRIVLIAGMNRGWTPSSAMDWLTSVWWNFGIWVGETIFAGTPIIFDIRQGAVFSVSTRLQWLALMHRDPAQRPRMLVIQLLGTVDDIVAPDDSVDYAVDPPGQDQDRSYFYLEVPNSGHKDIIALSPPKDVEAALKTEMFVTSIRPGEARSAFARICAEQRYVVFTRALRGSPEELLASQCMVTREQMTDSLPNPPNWKVTDVVFVIHGIRDKGFWTQKIARAIKQEAAEAQDGDGVRREFRSVTTSYGYFAMAPFVLWWIRKQKAEWLMDQYTEARAHYPSADFSYVGHSNGTYLVARALRDYSAAQFKRIVLAGSVVRCDYDWNGLINNKRVRQVLNYVATGDWVVAIFPKGMQPVRLLDLGSAGHDGFADAATGAVHQISYIAGSHGAGHQERHWADIARFIVSGEQPVKDASRQDGIIKTLGRFSSALVVLLIALILGLGALVAYPTLLCWIPYPGLHSAVQLINWRDLMTCSHEVTPSLAALRACATVLYFWLVYIVISRV